MAFRLASSLKTPLCGIRPSFCMLGGEWMGPSGLFWNQNRGAKRKGVKMMRLQMEKKLGIDPASLKRKRKQKELEQPQLSFAERLAQTKKKTSSSPSLQYPARIIDHVELPEATDDVYAAEFFASRTLTVTEAVEMHREQMDPSMLNNPTAPLRLRLELNMNLEKKNKYVADQKQIVDLPSRFQHGDKRTILAFVKDPELQKLALELGAEVAGGPDLVKKIQKGQFRTDDFDFAICHLDMMNDVTPLRGILKRKFPTRINGGLGGDINQLVDRYRYGTQYELQRDPTIVEWGLCDTVVATLDMSNEAIEANVSKFIASVCTHRPLTEKLGHFINRALLMVVPGTEYFPIDFWTYAPPLPQPESEEKQENIGTQENTPLENEIKETASA